MTRHITRFKADPIEEKKSAYQSRKRQSKQYNANRMACLRLDNFTCRNPKCPDLGDPQDKDFTTKDSHHLLGKKYDGVEYRLTLCRFCHREIGSNRHKNIELLKAAKKKWPQDFRWHDALWRLENGFK